MSRTKLLAMSILATTALLGAAATQAASDKTQPRAANAQASPPLLLQGNDPDEPGGDTDYDTDGSASVQSQDRNQRSSVESQNRNEGGETGERQDGESSEQGED